MLVIRRLSDKMVKATLRHVGISSRLLSQGNISKTCLYELHHRKGARFEPFAGFQMPIMYTNQSIREEHLHTRSDVSLFDVSHMMQTKIGGQNRVEFLESLTVADLQNLTTGKCVLSMFTNETGGILDDCIIGNCGDELFIVSNAGNAHNIWSWIKQKQGEYLERNNLSKDRLVTQRLVSQGLIALQGPKAASILQRFINFDLKDLEFMETIEENVLRVGKCRITRCGYTGEDGFEISIGSEKALELADMLLETYPVKLAGLGARDTLRLEAGLCLHGNDITEKTTPVEAVLAWTIHKRRRTQNSVPGFPGAPIILEQLRAGTEMKRTGLIAKLSGPPARKGALVKDQDSKEIGYVTSGTMSPSLGVNIAMAYISSPFSKNLGKVVSCEVRGKSYDYAIHKMPFVKSNYYIKKVNLNK